MYNPSCGMKGISSDDMEVRSRVGLAGRSTSLSSARAVGNVLYGLVGLLDVDEGRDLMRTYLDLHRNDSLS
jgi:hypothetical protein